MGLKNLLSNLGGGKPINPATSPPYPYHSDFGNDKSTSIFDNSTFNQKSIGFEDEEPFIKGGINLGGTSTLNSITGGFIRGGALMHAERLIQDTTRIGKFFVSTRGITFLAKQVALQKSNPKVSEPAFSKSSANHRTYNLGINTLAQVVGQGTGLHVNRQGITPLSKEGYADEEKFLKNSNKNRLINLYEGHIIPKKSKIGGDGKEPKTGIGKFFKGVKKFFAKPGEPLYAYQGGPGSTYGIGETKIQKYETSGATTLPITEGYETGWGRKFRNFTQDNAVPQFELNNDNLSSIYRFGGLTDNLKLSKDLPFTYLNDLEQLNVNKTYVDKFGFSRDDIKKPKTPIKTHEFFKDHILNGTSRVKNYLATTGRIFEDNYFKTRKDGKSYHREERVNLGNPGGNPNNINSTSTIDLINALDVFKADGDLNSNAVRDLIRFRIEAVDPSTPTKTDVMVFRAFLDDMGDNFTANYNEFNYNGRAETFYTYNSFNRDISFSFKIAAQSSIEMRPLYRKLNYLLSNTSPEYNLTSGRMMTPFMRLTIGAYFDRLPGVIKNVSISWQKDYPWEITLDAPEGGATSGLFTLPHVLDINVTYQPIHDFLPQKGINSPFIVPHESSPISNKPGRKLWNNEPIENNLNGAVAKIVHPSKDLQRANKKKMDTITSIPTIGNDDAALASLLTKPIDPYQETPEQMMARQQKHLNYLQPVDPPTFEGDVIPPNLGADDLPQNLGS